MFAFHASVVNGYLERRLQTVSRELQAAHSRLDGLRQGHRRSSHTMFVFNRGEPRYDPPGPMPFSMWIKPRQLPVLLAVCLLMIAGSDARMPKKHHHTGEEVRILHEEKKDQRKPTLPSDVIIFSKNLYSTMGKKNVTQVVSDFQPEFNELNGHMKGELGQTLGALFEVRMLDLQQSVRHARAMIDAISRLADGAPDCIFCDQKPSV